MPIPFTAANHTDPTMSMPGHDLVKNAFESKMTSAADAHRKRTSCGSLRRGIALGAVFILLSTQLD
jgi:hypothetical protein